MNKGYSEQQQVQHTPSHPPDTVELVKEFNYFWATGVVPLILAYFAYRSLKLKVEARNEIKRAEAKKKWEAEQSIDLNDLGDETVMSLIKEKLTKK